MASTSVTVHALTIHRALVLVFLFVLCVKSVLCVHTYDRDTLLKIRKASHGLYTFDSPLPEELRAAGSLPGWGGYTRNRGTRHEQHRGRRVFPRERRSPLKPPLPSLWLANVRSLRNKFDELLLLIQTNADFKNCSTICLTETWLDESVTDAVISPPGFTLLRADRFEALSHKSKGGGICFMINERWCNNSTVLHKHCSPHLEYISVKCRPFYLPREIASIILVGVYIPPTQSTEVSERAINELALHISDLERSNADCNITALGDFNRMNLSKELSNYKQQINCPTREDQILDHCYNTITSAYCAQAKAPLGNSDHAMIHLVPVYTQKVRSAKPIIRKVKIWSADAIETLRACFECTDWRVFHESCDNLDTYTDTVSSYIDFCVR